MPISGDAHRPRKILYSTSFQDVTPNIVIDITEQYESKCKAVACYKTQFEDKPDKREVYPPARDIFDYMEIRNRQYGYLIGTRYAECFIQKEKMAVDDPMKLSGKSIWSF